MNTPAEVVIVGAGFAGIGTPKSPGTAIFALTAAETATAQPAAISEEAIRLCNQFQKQVGSVKTDIPYDKVVATQFKHLWDQ